MMKNKISIILKDRTPETGGYIITPTVQGCPSTTKLLPQRRKEVAV